MEELKNIPMEKYLELPGISNSDLKHLKKSLAHYLHYKSIPPEERKTTPAQALGKAAHTLLFEPKKFEKEFVITPSDEWRSKENKIVRESAEKQGKTAIKPSDVEDMKAMVEAVKAHPTAGELIDLESDHEVERAVKFPYSPDGTEAEFECKIRYDYINHGKRYFLDLKTIEDASTYNKIINAIMNYEYYRQLTLYSIGARVEFGKIYRGVLIFVEKKAPFGIKVFELDDNLFLYAVKEIDTLLKTLAEYEQDKEMWTGYPLEIETAYLPNYLQGEIDYV